MGCYGGLFGQDFIYIERDLNEVFGTSLKRLICLSLYQDD